MQSRADAALMALITVCLPAGLYIAIHYVVMLRDPLHLYSVLLLSCTPAFAIALLPTGLWWLPGPPVFVRFLHNTILVGHPSSFSSSEQLS